MSESLCSLVPRQDNIVQKLISGFMTVKIIQDLLILGAHLSYTLLHYLTPITQEIYYFRIFLLDFLVYGRRKRGKDGTEWKVNHIVCTGHPSLIIPSYLYTHATYNHRILPRIPSIECKGF